MCSIGDGGPGPAGFAAIAALVNREIAELPANSPLYPPSRLPRFSDPPGVLPPPTPPDREAPAWPPFVFPPGECLALGANDRGRERKHAPRPENATEAGGRHELELCARGESRGPQCRFIVELDGPPINAWLRAADW